MYASLAIVGASASCCCKQVDSHASTRHGIPDLPFRADLLLPSRVQDPNLATWRQVTHHHHDISRRFTQRLQSATLTDKMPVSSQQRPAGNAISDEYVQKKHPSGLMR
jgi:hypothetical protein